MSLAKSGAIANCCAPNALMTLTEYLCDYGSDASRQAAQAIIAQELAKIPSEKVRQIAQQRIEKIVAGERDFRF